MFTTLCWALLSALMITWLPPGVVSRARAPVAHAGVAPVVDAGARAGSVRGVVVRGERRDPARFVWPVPGRVVRRFDPPPRPWLAGHRGVDLAVAPGVDVHAAGPGQVVYAGDVAGRGVVSVQHADGLRTTYEPVSATVAPGDLVAAGSVLGRLGPGHPGCPEAACLHWGLRRGAFYLDPLALLGLGRVRLLPLTAEPHP